MIPWLSGMIFGNEPTPEAKQNSILPNPDLLEAGKLSDPSPEQSSKIYPEGQTVIDIRPHLVVIYGGQDLMSSLAWDLGFSLGRPSSVSTMNDYMKSDSNLTELVKANIVVLLYETDPAGEPPANASWFIRELRSLKLKNRTQSLSGPRFISLELRHTTQNEILSSLIRDLGGEYLKRGPNAFMTWSSYSSEQFNQDWIKGVASRIRRELEK